MVRLRTVLLSPLVMAVLAGGAAYGAASWYWRGGQYYLPRYNQTAALQDILTDHKNTLDAITADLSALTTRVAALEGRMTTAEGNIATNAANIASNTSAITSHVGNTGNAHSHDARYIRHAESRLRSIRGLVRSDGSVSLGSGFTVTKGTTGQYTLNWNSSFSGNPTIQITTTRARHLLSWTVGASSAVLTIQDAGGTAVDEEFFFLATGP